MIGICLPILIYLYLLTECVIDVTLSVLRVTPTALGVTIFAIDMKTNYMIALNTQWKAPWRKPTVDVPMNAEASVGKQLDNRFKNMVGTTVIGVQDFIKKYWLE